MLESTICPTEPSFIPSDVSKQTSNIAMLPLQSEDENSSSFNSSTIYKKSFSTLPVVKQTLPRDDIIKQGFVLCKRIEEWYRATSKNIADVELRKRKQRWRQFKAVLTKDRLELYHTTSTKIKRMAHMIELNSKYGHTKLSILSPIDYIWSLEYLHTNKKRLITFHFQCSDFKDSQNWYMTLYQLLLFKTRMIGNPLSIPFVNLIIPEIDHFVIHIPLQTLSEYQQTTNIIYNIRMCDVKLAALQILEYRGIKPFSWTIENVELCWTLDSHTEWVTDKENTLLVGPQLVEQKHKLELRYLGDQSISSHREPCLDGLLRPWQWNDKEQIAVDQKKSEVYAILVGHFLFFVDISHYPYKTGKESSKKSWLSPRNGLIQKKNKISKEEIHHSFQSVLPSQRLFPLKYAKQILDLSMVEAIDTIQNSENNLFKICVQGGYTLCYESDTTQNMMEWIQLLKQNDEHRSQFSALLRDESNLWNAFCRKQHIIKSGMLYVNSNKLFNKMLCILTRNNGLLLFDIFKRKKWDNQLIHVPFYDLHYHLELDSNVYVYSGNECVSEQRQNVRKQQIEPARFFNDGFITEKMKPSDCYFVIWFKRDKTRFVHTRGCISLFKTGHYLGNSGRYLVFKTRNKIETNNWVWALHQEYEVSPL